LEVRPARSRDLEDWARLQSLTNGRRVHPEQWPLDVALRISPCAKSRANAAPGAECSE
jgi:hypothetical protein